jgi:hypothetical protein
MRARSDSYSCVAERHGASAVGSYDDFRRQRNVHSLGAMSEAEASTPRTQYIDVRCHWLREAVIHDKSLRLVRCSTTEMVADVLTKPLGSFEVARFHGPMSGIKPIAHPPLGGGYMGELACHFTSRRTSHFCLTSRTHRPCPGDCFLAACYLASHFVAWSAPPGE